MDFVQRAYKGIFKLRLLAETVFPSLHSSEICFAVDWALCVCTRVSLLMSVLSVFTKVTPFGMLCQCIVILPNDSPSLFSPKRTSSPASPSTSLCLTSSSSPPLSLPASSFPSHFFSSSLKPFFSSHSALVSISSSSLFSFRLAGFPGCLVLGRSARP